MENEIRIVIADDHPLLCKALRETLAEDPNLNVVGEAGDGFVALELINHLGPDVAILDIYMPGLSGLELAREVHRRQLPSKIIILTGIEEPELMESALKSGVRGFVRKDSAIVDVVACVNAVAAGRLFISSGLPRDVTVPLPPAGENPVLKLLTPAERRILKLIADGKSSKEIAEVMHIHYRTVDNHRTHISQKLGLHGSHSLLRFAIEHKDQLK